MKRFFPLAFFAMLAVGSGAAMAVSGSLSEFRSGVLPVLVHVDDQGKITEASPSTRLAPKMNRLLMQNLAEMISKPATDRHGHPISSQFIINVALQTSPRPEGDYDASFAYVSSKPVPSGSWYWVHIDGHRLALADRNSIQRIDHVRYNDHRQLSRPIYNRNYQRAPTTPARSAPRSTSAPAPARGR